MDVTLKQHLPLGARVSRYKLLEVLGEGGFAVTYRAWDSRLKRDVALKEFLPKELALREPGNTRVLPHNGKRDDYNYGLGRFLEEAQTLAQFHHPNIVRVTDHVEANGTAYLVMDYEQGRSLSNWLDAHPGPVPEATLRRWFVPILRGLAAVHKKGFLHRDIKPGNIYLRDAGEPMLIDFGSARQAMGEHSRAVTKVVSDGYAPVEQYGADASKQYARTDLYAIGATLYRCISGSDPVDAPTRRNAFDDDETDPLRPATEIGADRYDAPFLALIDELLRLRSKDRPPSAEAVLERLAGADKPHGQKQSTGTRQVRQPTGTRELTEDEPKPAPEPAPKRPLKPEPKRPAVRAAAGAVAALLLGFIAWQWLSPLAPDLFQDNPDEAAVVPATPADPIPLEVATEAPGRLMLELQPADAQVTLPDIESPYRPGLELPAGDYRVVVRRAGYEEFEDTLRIEAGRSTARAIALVEKPGRLMLELDPADAQVILPDIGPRYRPGLELAAGSYRVVVRRAGYKEFEDTLRIEAGRSTTRAIALAKSGPSVGDVFRDVLKSGGEGPEMVVLPTGRFRMGDLNGGGDSDEKPVRTVTISRPIAMGRYEVTFADYDRFARATGRDRPDDEGWGRSNRPVINVSRKDAQAYAAWLSKETGKRYRLPSEAEWEYAARAGTTTKYSWGNSITCSQARYGRRSGGECSDSRDGTVAVGSFGANAFGLHDLHGNVWEWVEDCYVNTYTGAPTDGSARTTGCGSTTRAVVRGGSWHLDPLWVRSANRYRGWPSARAYNVGFRLVQDINP